MLHAIIVICLFTCALSSQNLVSESKFPSEKDPMIDTSHQFKIGIIGGGIGGTATAFFLKNSLKDEVSIDLYESKVVGGRLSMTSNFNYKYETGGSIIHPQNQYMNEFIGELGLEKFFGCEAKAGIFDGEHYSFIESSWGFINIIKAFWKYGFDIFKLQNQNEEMLYKFSKIYEDQKDGIFFMNVTELLSSMSNDFPSLLKKSLKEFLKETKLHDAIINDIAAASTRANYGQMPMIHAFVGSVSLAAASSSKLWSVKGGNKKVPEGLLKLSEAVIINRFVSKISALDGKFRVWSEDNGEFRDYDAVAIAAPLTEDHRQIDFENFPETFRFRGNFEKIFCTLVRGELNSTTLNFKEAGMAVDEILTTNPNLFYNSLGRQFPLNIEDSCSVGVDYKVFKVFSPHALSQRELSFLFSEIDSVEAVSWLAYPHYSSTENAGRFELFPGLYYNNAIEAAASAMEMSAISAKNTALLIQSYLKGPLLSRSKSQRVEL